MKRLLVSCVFVLGGCIGSATSNGGGSSTGGGTSYAGGSGNAGGGSAGGTGGGSNAGGGGSNAGGGGAAGGGTTTDDGGAPTSGGADMTLPTGTPFLYIGGYGSQISIYKFDDATGKLTATASSPVAFAGSPSFLAVDPQHRYLYAVDEDNSQVVGYTIDQTTGALTATGARVGSGGQGPAFLSVDRTGKYVLVPNYTNGAVATFAIGTNGALGAQIGSGAPGQLAHMMITDPANKYAFVPCLMSNYIAEYTFDDTTGKIGAKPVTTFAPAQPAAAAQGPRHIAFAPSGKMVYLINETASTMTSFTYDPTTGALTPTQTLSTLPTGVANTGMTGAEVVVHPNGKWLYGSNRDAAGKNDSIAVFDLDATGKMTMATTVKSGGVGPRNFTVDPTGQWMIVANQMGNNIVVFKIDPTTGIPAAVNTPTTVSMPSFVGIVNLPGG